MTGAFEVARTRHVEAESYYRPPVFFFLKQIGKLAIAKRLLLICLFPKFPKESGFMAYGPNVAELFRRCGNYVGKILHGAKSSDLPIQRPEGFDLVINLKTAALGITVPPLLRAIADEVIE
jgi:putative ABC transport system substrate-binding protein